MIVCLYRAKGVKMTAVRKIVDSSALEDIIDLPPAFRNKKVEVILFPLEEPSDFLSADKASIEEKFPLIKVAQIEEWAKAPQIQALVGILKGTGLPEDISIEEIRDERLSEKYKV
jgi:hypothetical protein